MNRKQKHIIAVVFIIAILVGIVSLVEPREIVDKKDCYKCELISINDSSTIEYLPCSTDIEHYKAWVYDRGKISIITCNEIN